MYLQARDLKQQQPEVAIYFIVVIQLFRKLRKLAAVQFNPRINISFLFAIEI
jgi:hypothetical protein